CLLGHRMSEERPLGDSVDLSAATSAKPFLIVDRWPSLSGYQGAAGRPCTGGSWLPALISSWTAAHCDRVGGPGRGGGGRRDGCRDRCGWRPWSGGEPFR